MKKLLMAAAIGAAGLVGTGAQAASDNQSFDVNINLTAVCTLSPVTNVQMDYTAGVGTTAVSGGNFDITCTPGVVYNFFIDQPLNTVATFPVLDNSGINLTYSLATPAGGIGSGGADPKQIVGSMAAAQPGNCASALCTNAAATNKTYFLRVEY